MSNGIGEELTGHWKKHSDARFLNGEDLTKELTFTIKKVTKEELYNGNGKVLLPVVWFEEIELGLVLSNQGNQRTITRVVGSGKFELWKGKKITVYGLDGKWFGNEQCAVRVKLIKNK